MVWKGFHDFRATIEIDLTKSTEELWQNLDKEARWGVNRAKKEGLTVIEGKEDNGWQTFYRIYVDTCKRGMILPLPLTDIKKEGIKLFVCKKDKEIIAGAAIKLLESNKRIELFLNASLSDYLKFQPNNLLYWSIMEYAKKNDATIFDLGGYQIGAKPGNKLYEINRFKERWGGKIVLYYIYSKNPFYILGRKIIRNFYFIKRIRDRLRMKN